MHKETRMKSRLDSNNIRNEKNDLSNQYSVIKNPNKSMSEIN